MAAKPEVCVIGAGPCGMSALYHFANLDTGNGNAANVVCYEKQSTWGGLWNYTWRTGTDEYGEPCHGGMYRHLWSNGPKECLEYPDYTFEEHFGRPIPSFPPRPVLRDYLEGRFKKCKRDLKQYIKFETVVRNVEYIEQLDKFKVVTTDLRTMTNNVEMFSHVIVAIGIFNVPNKPSFNGIETFPGRIVHAHDFRNAEEYKDQRLLVIGSSYSAEDIALQCKKFGVKNITCTWRTKPMGFKFPQGIEERPLLQKINGRTVTFKDGSSAEFDTIMLCTGYIYAFPFLESNLRLSSTLTVYPANLYKGTVWLGGGNNKLIYLGIQDQYYTFTMFDVQALWACRYITGQLPGEPKTRSDMIADMNKWVTRRKSIKDCHDDIDFQTDFVGDLSQAVNYSPQAVGARAQFHKWEHDKERNVTTYRDECFSSLYTGSASPKYQTAWWQAYDDSIEAFIGKKA